MSKLRVDPKSHLRITIGTAFAMGMIGADVAQRFGLGWGSIVILAGCLASWNAYRVWWSTWEPRFQSAVMRAQMGQRDAFDLLAAEVGDEEAHIRMSIATVERKRDSVTGQTWNEVLEAGAKAAARSIDQAIIDGDPDTMEFLRRKMTPYEAGEDGPLCTKCHHRWCPGDCEDPKAGRCEHGSLMEDRCTFCGRESRRK